MLGQYNRWTNREFYQKHVFLDHFLLILDFNGKMKALNGGNPFMKSTEKDRERGAATLGEWKRRRTEILSNPPLTITSLLCIEDAFETYLPASMNPSENVISKARKKTGFLSRTVCRFHKSVNCLSESSQIQTETWLLFFFLGDLCLKWLLENANIFVIFWNLICTWRMSEA